MFQTEANSMGVVVRHLYVRGPECKASPEEASKNSVALQKQSPV